MTSRTSRRTVLRAIGAATAGVALAGCSGNGDDESQGDDQDHTDTDASPTGEDDGASGNASFRAELSDDESIPGHQSANSDGTGTATFEQSEQGGLEFTVEYEGLEGDVNGIHIHGEGAADGGYLVRLFEPEDSDHADGGVVTGDRLDASSGSVSDIVGDEHVNPSGDYDDEVETVEGLIDYLQDAKLGESGGVVNIHTEHDPDSELAGQVEPR
jgi:hypothetical protein